MPRTKHEPKTVRDEITPFAERGDVITIRSTPALDKAIDEYRSFMAARDLRLCSRAEAVRRLMVIGLGAMRAEMEKDLAKAKNTPESAPTDTEKGLQK